MDAALLFLALGWTYFLGWFFSLPFRLFGRRAADVAHMILWLFFLVRLLMK